MRRIIVFIFGIFAVIGFCIGQSPILRKSRSQGANYDYVFGTKPGTSVVKFVYSDTILALCVDSVEIFTPEKFCFSSPEAALSYWNNKAYSIHLDPCPGQVDRVYAISIDNVAEKGTTAAGIWISEKNYHGLNESRLRYHNSNAICKGKRYPVFLTDAIIMSNIMSISCLRIGQSSESVIEVLHLKNEFPASGLQQINFYHRDADSCITSFKGGAYYRNATLTFTADTLSKIEIGIGELLNLEP